jgi:hypothetical protein
MSQRGEVALQRLRRTKRLQITQREEAKLRSVQSGNR